MSETDDIKAEEIFPELKETLEEPKALKKIHKLAAKLLEKINGRIDAERNIIRRKIDASSAFVEKSLDKFVKDTNSDLDRFKKRYEAMYTDIVRRVMLKQEQRVFSSELFQQATLDLCVEKLYRLENKFAPDEELDQEAYKKYIVTCAKKHESFMQKHADEFTRKHKEERDVAIQKENEASDKAENSGRGKDQSSGQTDSKDSGTTDPQDNKGAESTPGKE